MMFGSRRHRPPNPPLTSATANPNASTAAAAAFMSASHNPNRSLSSAAAAAALRARPHTPTNVAEVQTKRTMGRSPSVSSVGSAAGPGRGASGLQRRGSSGSMTERTFRSPSPGRGERGRSPHQARPPVPAIPAGHRNSTNTNSAGVAMQNFRTASQKMEAGLPSWYTQPTGDPSNVRRSDAPMRSSWNPPSQGLERDTSTPQRPDSRSSSINFSYPSRLRGTQSPPASTSVDYDHPWNDSPLNPPDSPPRSSRASVTSYTVSKADVAMVYDPNSRRMVPKADLMAMEYRLREAAEQPRTKRQSGGVGRSGSHLARGTVGRVKGTAVSDDKKQQAAPRREQVIVVEAPVRREEKARALDKALATESILTEPVVNTKPKEEVIQSRASEPEPEPEPVELHTPSPTPRDAIKHTSSPPSGKSILRRPPVVQEELEEDDEDVEPVIMPSKEVLDALDAVPVRDTLYKQAAELNNEASAAPDAHPEPVPEPPREQSPVVVENKPILELSRENGSVRRSASNSPVRMARFSTSPPENLAVRHAPPPRSASPIKSALKYSSPSPREGSPSDGSDHMITPEPEPSVTRKKSVRVSFDDRIPVVVGEAAPIDDMETPVFPSPQQQTKRPWYSNIGRSKKKEFTLDDDEIMKPRPALPSFGSIRSKKLREPEEERPLIRPHPGPATSSPAGRAYSTPKVVGTTQIEVGAAGLSSDNAIGSVLAQDQNLRNEANTSRLREPLPPIVTSAEGFTHVSDLSSSSDSEEEQISNMNDSDEEAIQSTQATNIESRSESQSGSMVLDEKIPAELGKPIDRPNAIELPATEIPAISVTQPTPVPTGLTDQTIMSKKSEDQQQFGVPGGFPYEESDEGKTSRQDVGGNTNASDPPSTVDSIFEPEAEVIPPQANTLPQTTIATTPQAHEDKSDDDSSISIYSDAYEDLSDMEGDGFQSLNAVVESPVSKEQIKQISKLSADLPKEPEQLKSEQLEVATQSSIQLQMATPSLQPAPQESDWEQAKLFWRSLTDEKRRQLEREAMEDAGADGDREDIQPPTRRPSNRKKTAEQKAAVSAGMKARAAEPVVAPEAPINADRVYMIQPGSKANHEPISPAIPTGRMRTSMRGEKPTTRASVAGTVSGEMHTGMRKSMRPKTATTADKRVSSQPERPSSWSASSSRPQTARPASTSYDLAASSAGNAAAKIKPTLQRRGSDASESSFKRSRIGASQGLGFRRTMRQTSGPQPSPEGVKGSSRFSLRSLSPPGSPFRRTSFNAGSGPPVSMMHRTLRSGSESSREGKRSSLHFPSFGLSSKSSSSKRKSKRASRFGDSSDEDEPVNSAFHSRFEDSSDEENPQPSSSIRPLSRGTLRGSGPKPAVANRSTPVPETAEDSPDLPDSDDDEPSMQVPSPLGSPRATRMFRPTVPRSSSGIGTSTLQPKRSGRGMLIPSSATPAVAPDKHGRSSFMGSILRRNKMADQAGKIQRSGLMDSAARRDTQLERDANQLREIRSEVGTSSSPKLQKRHAFTRGDSWPLPDTVDEERPGTASGVAGKSIAEQTRPSFASRRSTSLGLPGVTDAELESVEQDELGFKKKKKFSALRRMFRLDN